MHCLYSSQTVTGQGRQRHKAHSVQKTTGKGKEQGSRSGFDSSRERGSNPKGAKRELEETRVRHKSGVATKDRSGRDSQHGHKSTKAPKHYAKQLKQNHRRVSRQPTRSR